MFNTYERELIANQRHQDMLQTFAERQRIEQGMTTGRPTGLLATLTAKLRGTATETRLATPSTARA